MASRVEHLPRLGSAALLVLLTVACGGAGQRAAGVPAPSPSVASPSPAVGTHFTGTVALTPAARVRFGPGMDMPIMDLQPVGTTVVFDGWYRRADDPPQADVITGQLQWWSRDWYRLADHRGWIHSAAVVGFPPASLPPVSWDRPPNLPRSTAALRPISIDYQDQRASCEVAALKMALAYRGILVDEPALLALVGVDERGPQLDSNGDIARWGDPNVSFVGEPGGSATARTGYGVYAAPIARAARQAGARVVRAGTAVRPSEVYSALLAGDVVVAWVTSDYSRGAVRSWVTWDGAAVRYSLKEHAVTVIAVTPTSVLINDPWVGPVWKTRVEFETAYSDLGQMAVVL